ncbi:hypothetical protein AAEO56_04815 [Flavobacterium sp. DGU11]|uniref:CarboxypepD_reg-like domain-containing protein n=1 Tax=Flavobacterium arundinis TaxID=3139143 RepID=A0ABU9HTT1_9FLAO
MKSKLICLLLLVCTVAFPQGRKSLRGNVKSGGVTLVGVFVINNKTGDETKTDSQGNFIIAAKPGDKLAVYSDKTETREFVITEDSFRNMPYAVSVEYKATELNEVVIDETNKDDPYALGQKGRLAANTPAERKAVTGARIGPKFNDPTVQGMAINGDGIINIFTGKRKALKRAVEMERRERLISKFKTIYSDETLIVEFGIPKENVDGFSYYCIEDKKMAQAITEIKTDVIESLMPDMVLKYVEMVKNGK